MRRVVDGKRTVLWLLLTLGGCENRLAPQVCTVDCGGTTPAPGAPARIEIRPLTDTLEISVPSLTSFSARDTTRLTAFVLDANGDDARGLRVVWTSLSPAIASVDSVGLVKARGNTGKPVQVTIEARTGELADSVVVVIYPPLHRVVTNLPPRMLLGAELELTAAVRSLLGDGYNPLSRMMGGQIEAPPPSWHSSDPTVIAVEGGVLKARAVGRGMVSYRSVAGRTDSVEVIVQERGYAMIFLEAISTTNASINDLSDRGDIVGVSRRPDGIFGYLLREGRLIDLRPFLHAFDVNERGEIAGAYLPAGAEWSLPALWRDGHIVAVSVSPPPKYTCPGAAEAVNDSGAVAVRYCSESAVIVQGVTQWLPDIASWRRTWGMSSSVMIVGETSFGGPAAGAWFNGRRTVLTAGRAEAAARAVNDKGEIVGFSVGFARHGFVWSGGVFRDIGHLGAFNTSAVDINDAGTIVGVSADITGKAHAVVVEGGRMSRLTDLVERSGWEITEAYAINNPGQIVARARSLATSAERYVLLTPH